LFFIVISCHRRRVIATLGVMRHTIIRNHNQSDMISVFQIINNK